MKQFGLAVALLFSFATTVAAQPAGFEGLYKDRSGRMEISLGGNQASGFSRETNGASLSVKSSTNWSFGLAYNFDQHWNLGLSLESSNPSYTAVLNGDNGTSTVQSKMSVYHTQFNGTYHFLTGAFTPYVQVGGGWSLVDSNVIKPGSEICWWDPWWMQYRCTWSTYGNDDFSYNAGVGLRYEFDRNFFVRGGYTAQWVKVGRQTEQLDQGRIEIGFMF